MKKLFALFLRPAILMVLVGHVTLTGCVTLPPLWDAANRGDINAVKALLDKGANVNEWNAGTVLMVASSKGDIDMVKFLIERGADVNAMSNGGWSALGFAAENGYTEIVKILIDKGANVDKAIMGLEQRAAFLAKPPVIPELVAKSKSGINLLKEEQRGLPTRDGWAYYSKGRYQEAINSFKQGVNLNSLNSSNFIGLSASYNALKQYDEAITAAKRALELKPDSAQAYSYLGGAYSYKKQFDEAINAYQKAIEIDPRNAIHYSNIGYLFLRKEDYRRAADNLKKAAELTPNDGKLLSNLAITYRLMGRYDDAIEAANKAVALMTIEKTITRETIISKSAAPLFSLRSLAYREKGRLEESYKDAEKAYSLNSDDSLAKSAMSITYIDKGKYTDALKILSTITNSPFDRILEAIAQAKLGDMKKAVELYSSIPEDYLASERAPNKSYKKALLESLKPYVNAKKESAKSLEARGQYREALKEYSELLKIADDRGAKELRKDVAVLIKRNPYLAELPEEARKYALRAEVLLKDGKFEESLNEYNSAIKIAPFAQQLYFNTAFVYGELKKYKSAKRYMNIYIELYPDAPNVRQGKDEIYKWELMTEKEGKS